MIFPEEDAPLLKTWIVNRIEDTYGPLFFLPFTTPSSAGAHHLPAF